MIALAMIMGIWIAVRVTFNVLEPDPEPVPDARDSADPGKFARPGPVVTRPAARAPPQTAPPGAPLVVPQALPHLALREAGQPPRFAAPVVPPAARHGGGDGGPALRWVAAPAGGIARAEAQPEGNPAPGCPGAECRGESRAQEAGPVPQLEQELALPAAVEGGQERRRRWSADGWVLVRGEGSGPGLAAGAASYGGSQAGGVLRYALAPGSALRPQAYVRVSSALGGQQVRQSESAFGLMLRPVPHVPLAVMGELRLQEGIEPLRARPVIMAVSALPPLRLPFAAEADIYAQGGWAGGRDATGFYDLAATVQRRVAEPLRGFRLSAGGGVWSGGQRGAARLDVGPRIEVRTLLGPPSRRLAVRVGADWRFRVAGRARPGSGPALTISAGF